MIRSSGCMHAGIHSRRAAHMLLRSLHLAFAMFFHETDVSPTNAAASYCDPHHRSISSIVPGTYFSPTHKHFIALFLREVEMHDDKLKHARASAAVKFSPCVTRLSVAACNCSSRLHCHVPYSTATFSVQNKSTSYWTVLRILTRIYYIPYNLSVFWMEEVWKRV